MPASSPARTPRGGPRCSSSPVGTPCSAGPGCTSIGRWDGAGRAGHRRGLRPSRGAQRGRRRGALRRRRADRRSQRHRARRGPRLRDPAIPHDTRPTTGHEHRRARRRSVDRDRARRRRAARRLAGRRRRRLRRRARATLGGRATPSPGRPQRSTARVSCSPATAATVVPSAAPASRSATGWPRSVA